MKMTFFTEHTELEHYWTIAKVICEYFIKIFINKQSPIQKGCSTIYEHSPNRFAILVQKNLKLGYERIILDISVIT